MDPARRLRRFLMLAAGMAGSLGLGACKPDEPASSGAGSKDSAVDAAMPDPPRAPDETATTPAEALLQWLDPDAVAVAYVNLPADIDVDALSVVFAVPPKLEALLGDVGDVDEGLDAILPLDAPRPDAWLGAPALASAAMVSSGTYVLRPLTKPRAEVEALLLSSGLEKTEAEGFTILVPQNAFPWKVAFLTEQVVAFIPAKEVGFGLSPLTAGRDMPPSEVEGRLRQVLRDESGVAIEAYAAGPLLHYDLGQDVLQAALQARIWQGKGLDVQVQLVPSGDPSAAVETLSGRATPLETDQVQALARRVAFGLDGTAISGRLQLTPTDMAVLGGGA